MRTAILAALLLAACAPDFPMDAAPVAFVATVPGGTPGQAAPLHFPARIGVARVVYRSLTPATGDERAMWEELTAQAGALGSFVPLSGASGDRALSGPKRHDHLRQAAAQQRLEYLLLVDLEPGTGIASALFIDVATGGILATAEAASPRGGAQGFWGGRITNSDRLARVTAPMSAALLPEIVAMLNGLAARAS